MQNTVVYAPITIEKIVIVMISPEISISSSLFQALCNWGRAKTSEKKKNEGGLRRGAAGEPVRL